MTTSQVFEEIRERAISYARSQPYKDDVVSAMVPAAVMDGERVCSSILDDVKFRIGIDNMLADAFSMGYAAAVDDRQPARALVDRPRSVKPRSAAPRAPKSRK